VLDAAFQSTRSSKYKKKGEEGEKKIGKERARYMALRRNKQRKGTPYQIAEQKEGREKGKTRASNRLATAHGA